MAQQFRHIALGTAAYALLLCGAAADARQPTVNRSVESVHQPVVSRTDFVFDVTATRYGLAPGEADRLSGWFDGLRLGYGDTIRIDDPAGWNGGAQDGVAAIVSRYGMLLSRDPAPATTGHPASGTIRVVVSRAVAHVDGCPNWSHSDVVEYSSSTGSNFGCSTASNLAAMIANPEDLVEGRSGDRSGDAMLSVKAIKTYRDAVTTGAAGVKAESSKSAGGAN